MNNFVRHRWLRRGSAFTLLASLVAAADLRADAPDLSIGAREYPDANAVVLRWEQDWTLAPDGTIHRREHQWVKLLNRRPIGRYADRTIDYRDGEDEVVIHVAQTHLPDGQVQPVPEYSYNLGATESVAGWPAYADWKQRIISFSGVQPGATLELDYEVITRPGVLPCMSAEVRLDSPDPVHERIVRITTPRAAALTFAVDRADAKEWSDPAKPAPTGTTVHAWRFTGLPAASSEALVPGWRQSSPRLRFSTTTDATRWAAGWIDPVSAAAQPDARIETFARETTKDKLDDRARLEAIGKALAERFNHLESREAWRSRSCRSADAVFAASYGNPLETAAVGLAALRVLNLPAQALVAVDLDAWSAEVPTDDAFAAIVLRAETADGVLWLHPKEGILTNPGNWGRRILLDIRENRLDATVLNRRGEEAVSRIALSAKVDVADDGSAKGTMTLRLSGLFADRPALVTTESQKKLVETIVRRTLSDFTVAAFHTTELSDQAFAVTADLAAAELPAVDSSRMVQVGDGPIFLKDIKLPLAGGTRLAPLQIPGAIDERVEVRIVYPENWRIRVLPQSLARVEGVWGHVVQQVVQEDHSVSVLRAARVEQPLLTAEAYAALRDALNVLRADDHRTIVAGL